MTNSEIIAKLKSDAVFCVGFAIDNNLEGVVASLRNNGVFVPSDYTPKSVSEIVLRLLNTDKAKAIKVISEVPYNKYANNYTASEEILNFLRETQPSTTVTAQQKFSLDALLGGLGSALTTYTGISLAQSGTTGLTTTEQMQREAELQRQREAERRRQNMFLIGGFVFVVVLGVVIYFATKKTDK